MKIKNSKSKFLYDFKLTKDYIKLNNLKEGDKLSIVSDVAFKTLFIPEERKKYSVHLISLLVDVDEEILLKNMTISNSELDRKNIYQKGQRCDYVATIDNTILNIEVNNNKSKENLERNLEYALKLYAKNIKVGSKYKYNQVIQINLNNFSFEGIEDSYTVNYIQNEKLIALTDKIIIINIYLPNIIKKCYNEGVNSLDECERYLYSLIETDPKKLEGIAKEEKLVGELIKESSWLVLDDDMREAYDHEQADKEQCYMDGYEEGEEKTRKENAINLYNIGISKEKIIQALNITEEQFNEYLNDSN